MSFVFTPREEGDMGRKTRVYEFLTKTTYVLVQANAIGRNFNPKRIEIIVILGGSKDEGIILSEEE